jgi:anti-anti-sigma regulatory factor
VSRPAALLRGVSSAGTDRGRAVEITAAGGVVRVSGTLGPHAADRLRRTVARASFGGTRPVTVALTDVDLLCSAVVQVLHEVHAAGGATLVAPMGSPAQHVLDLVGLPYAS